MLYTRPQLVLLLAVLTAAGAGLAVGHWRAHHPELVERLEQLDRTPAVAAGQPGGAIASPSAASGRESAPDSRAPASPVIDRAAWATGQADCATRRGAVAWTARSQRRRRGRPRASARCRVRARAAHRRGP